MEREPRQQQPFEREQQLPPPPLPLPLPQQSLQRQQQQPLHQQSLHQQQLQALQQALQQQQQQQHSDGGAPTGPMSAGYTLPAGGGGGLSQGALLSAPQMAVRGGRAHGAHEQGIVGGAHEAFLADMEPVARSVRSGTGGGREREAGREAGRDHGQSANLGSIGSETALRTNLSSASLSDGMGGSLRDLQQLAAAYSRPGSHPPRVAGTRSGAAGRHDGGGGKQTSHSPPGPLGGERFVAAMGAVGGTDDLGDAAEMQLDGILDMLDNWEQFER